MSETFAAHGFAPLGPVLSPGDLPALRTAVDHLRRRRRSACPQQVDMTIPQLRWPSYYCVDVDRPFRRV